MQPSEAPLHPRFTVPRLLQHLHRAGSAWFQKSCIPAIPTDNAVQNFYLQAYLVLHAAVVEQGDAALILAGSPGIGKSTLVGALAAQGFRFFSDDFCPIHRQTRSVHPFPRTMWALEPGKQGMNRCRSPRAKRPVRLSTLSGGVGEAPVPPGAVVCLEAEDSDRDGVMELAMGLKPQGVPTVVDALTSVPGLTCMPTGRTAQAFRVRFPSSGGNSAIVKTILKRHEDHIWNVYRVDRIRPDFRRSPVLSPMEPVAAAVSLLRDLKNFPSGMGDSSVRLGPLLWELSALLEGVPAYRCRVGRLDEMVGMMVELVETGNLRLES